MCGTSGWEGTAQFLEGECLGGREGKLVLFKCGTEMQPLCKMCVERQLGLPLKCLVKYPYGAVFELLSRLA